ncbi:hypothetical protein GCM10023192_53860 [Amycolatopsis samaneae]
MLDNGFTDVTVEVRIGGEGSRTTEARLSRVSPQPPNTDLGAVRGRYPTDNRRRGWAAVILLAAGLPFTAFAVAFWVFLDHVSGKLPSTGADPLWLPSVAVGLGLGMLLMGGWWGVHSFTHRGEFFELHDNGLRHSRGGRTRSVPWAQVRRVTTGSGRNTALTRWAGGTFTCTLHLADGKKLTFTALTEDAVHLARQIRTAVERNP